MRSQRCAALLRYWQRLRGDRPLPHPSEVEPAELKAVLPHLMMVGISYAPFRAQYRLVGTEIARFAKFDFTGRYADALKFQNDETQDWTVYYRQVADAGKPGFGVTHWTVEGGLRRWIEFIICPLSSDGNTVDRCISLEDYEHLKYEEIDGLPPVGEQ
jgi:hypothetical protein